MITATHRQVVDAMKLVNSDRESVERAEATKLIADLVLQDCGHVAPTPVDTDLSVKLTSCVTCFAYYSYTEHATRNRQVVSRIVRRHLLARSR